MTSSQNDEQNSNNTNKLKKLPIWAALFVKVPSVPSTPLWFPTVCLSARMKHVWECRSCYKQVFPDKAGLQHHWHLECFFLILPWPLCALVSLHVNRCTYRSGYWESTLLLNLSYWECCLKQRLKKVAWTKDFAGSEMLRRMFYFVFIHVHKSMVFFSVQYIRKVIFSLIAPCMYVCLVCAYLTLRMGQVCLKLTIFIAALKVCIFIQTMNLFYICKRNKTSN